MSPSLSIRHWEVFPKSVRLSVTPQLQSIPLSLRGSVGAPRYESSNPDVVSVDWSGTLQCGTVPGNAMIMIWRNTAHDSVRHVQVEIREKPWFADHPDFANLRISVAVAGKVVNAINGVNLSGVFITFRRSETGPIVAQAMTNNYGNYQVELFEGLYYYEATATDFIAAHGLLSVAQGNIIGRMIVLSPELNGMVARIVLQWGATPEDLDSHITGPLPNGQRFHVYYAHSLELDAAELDYDVTDSYGPETITVHRWIPGIYRYCVHDYDNSGYPNNMELANSGAVVRVFMEDGREITFRPPNQPGTVWNVFTIDGVTGAVTPVNTIEYQPDITLIGS